MAEVAAPKKTREVLIYSTLPCYNLVLQVDTHEWVKDAEGHARKIPGRSARILSFEHNRAWIEEEELERVKREKPWYGSEWISAPDLLKLRKSDATAFDGFVGRMAERRRQSGRYPAANSDVALSRAIDNEFQNGMYREPKAQG